ncbi:MAG: nucleotidyltransferase domain-containing protein [Candidatus Brockarchaeota archaeon]|nr:nucleotidyltransferase domain-containing protein [Candidatus Brockarchaeota archaeon]MBO3809531.1 nucleotidyltransferase domain-containing protein [Candidatus Brockarchaeota archaeon]
MPTSLPDVSPGILRRRRRRGCLISLRRSRNKLEELLIREAARREEVFKNLPELLKRIKKIGEADKESRVFLFGFVARDEHVLTSDIDILILTKLQPCEIIAKLRKEGFDEPFEFHETDEKMFSFYCKLIRELREIKRAYSTLLSPYPAETRC